MIFRYLQEDKPHGSAGGLYNFKDLLMEDDPVWYFLNLLLQESGVTLYN